MKVRGLGIVPAAMLILAPMALADKATPGPEAQTRAALKRMGDIYGPAWTLTYESVVTLRQYGPSSGTRSLEATVHGVLQKPNKFRLEVMQNNRMVGLLVSDGSRAIAFNPVQSVFHRQAAPTDLALGGLLTTDTSLARLDTILPGMAMTPTLFSLATRPDFLGPDAAAFAASSLALHGRDALDCSWTEAGATEHILFNQATGLPLRTIDSSTDKDGTTTERQEDLVAVQVGAVPLPPSAFDWSPPPGAKEIPDTPPAAAAASPPGTPPGNTPPLPHRRRHSSPAPETPPAGRTPPGKIIRP